MIEFVNSIDKIMKEQKLVVPQQYTYPPRKSYIMGISEHNKILENKNLEDEYISIYVHFPFVDKKCDLCNLYAFECADYDLYDKYIFSVLLQLEQSLIQLPQAILLRYMMKTIYLIYITEQKFPIHMYPTVNVFRLTPHSALQTP